MKKSTFIHSPIYIHRYIAMSKSKPQCHYNGAHHISHVLSHQVGVTFLSRSWVTHFSLCNFQKFHSIDCDKHWVIQMTNFGQLCNRDACDKVMRFYAPTHTTYRYWPTNFGKIEDAHSNVSMVLPSASLIFQPPISPMSTTHLGVISGPIPNLHLHSISPIINPTTKSLISNSYFCPATCRYKCTTNSP